MPIERPTVSVTYSFVDERGKHAHTSFDADASLPLDVIRDAAAKAADQLAEISRAALVGYSLTYSVVYSIGQRGSHQSRTEHKGVLSFHTATGKSVTYHIPAIRPEFFRSDRLLIITDTPFERLIQLFLQEPWCDSRGARLVSIASAYEAFRRMR